MYRGAGRTSLPHFADSDTPLLEQEVQTEGRACACPAGAADCLAWETFVLEEALDVERDEQYTLHLTAAAAAQGVAQAQAFRVGLLILDPYTRGSNNFAVRRAFWGTAGTNRCRKEGGGG